MNRTHLLPTLLALLALLGVAACNPPVPVTLPEPGEAAGGSTAFAVAVDARLGPLAAGAAPARARSIYAIVPD